MKSFVESRYFQLKFQFSDSPILRKQNFWSSITSKGYEEAGAEVEIKSKYRQMKLFFSVNHQKITRKSFRCWLKRRVMDVINKLYNSVSSSVSQLSNVLPGNPLSREYDIESQVCSAGIGKLQQQYILVI